MFIYNGWIQIAENTLEIDDDHLDEIMTKIRTYIDSVRWHNAFIDLRQPNGFPVLSIHGCNNHKVGRFISGNHDVLLDIYKFVGQNAPGSHGILYIADDEEPGYQNEYQVFILKRGKLERTNDPFFSPIIPTIEDP
jgi:hypothetical protein